MTDSPQLVSTLRKERRLHHCVSVLDASELVEWFGRDGHLNLKDGDSGDGADIERRRLIVGHLKSADVVLLNKVRWSE